ncbi:MAG: 3-methyl-2-oxobutanoate hydroxymethyltransferase [Oceanospirillaceae bacterium]|jgi:3-methyl-2-oxobutanoate hydroxymethyltransferase|uniref:3-methyl-2-oxobutanoate hydroxymethyltransferase n=1 Tax=Marinobacterium litorale TaxID=404770 RepID=UPI000416705F|nr:3-methyl-2-oxobutanoate hydroxymethyltransferase [Marinobacterium litorale]MBS99309.1 3-methyl-2-oxobutanoate hydroxymethyltransferase [Oceanospirillaceae bacterium]
MSNITLRTLTERKESGGKFASLTAYDATFANQVSQAGIELILVGDSLGMVLQGHSSTVPVTLEEMAYHTRSVARGNTGSMIMADLPFMTYANADQAMASSAELMRAGAHIVKLEGAGWLCDSVSQLAERGVPVCAHLGLTPQAVNKLGGYRVQGRDRESALAMIEDARRLEEAGASMLLLECVPSLLAQEITLNASIPVIGIGAGPHTDAQVLVLHDMLGLNPGRTPKFVKNFMEDASTIQEALTHFAGAVRDGSFPSAEHSFD